MRICCQDGSGHRRSTAFAGAQVVPGLKFGETRDFGERQDQVTKIECIDSAHDLPRQLIVVKNTLNPKIG